jgi:hypothetical protein
MTAWRSTLMKHGCVRAFGPCIALTASRSRLSNPDQQSKMANFHVGRLSDHLGLQATNLSISSSELGIDVSAQRLRFHSSFQGVKDGEQDRSKL